MITFPPVVRAPQGCIRGSKTREKLGRFSCFFVSLNHEYVLLTLSIERFKTGGM